MSNPLAARFADVPVLVDPALRVRFETALHIAAAHPKLMEMLATASADDGFWPAPDDWRYAYRPYVVRDGILFIPVKGILLHDFPWAIGSWATGYLYIARALERGLADLSVRAIALVCDSPGGEGAGCFELVDKIYAARLVKPIRAFAHEGAYSAGYAVASAAHHIVVSRTGGVGSIGVRMMHVDLSRSMEDMGVKITFIFSGKHKVDGNPFEPLPDAVKARFQFLCDGLYGVFCGSVERNRSMDEKAVRATEAECFTATEAVANGLADSIGPFDDAVAAFNADLSQADAEGEDPMTTAATAAAPAALTAAALETARTEARAEGVTAGKAEGSKEGSAAERARISAIVGSDEAKGRGELASHLAFSTTMTADEAKALLAKSPKEAAAAAVDPLSTAMAGVKNPKVGADAESQAGDDVAAVGAAVKAYLGARAA